MSWIVDSDTYFRAAHEAFCRATRSIFVLGWDIDSRTRLVDDESAGDRPTRLGPLLESLVQERPDLHVYLLIWDYSTLYLKDREVLAPVRLGWETSRRLRFAYDSHHPEGASHHQKIVVVDDVLAFVGGMDLTTHRWDRPAHDPGDESRRLPSGKPYPPQHDVQAAVTGEVVGILAGMARRRWTSAVDGDLPPPDPAGDIWPASLETSLEDTEVLVTRTHPEHRGERAVQETERWHLAAFEQARRHVFIENQFLTSHVLIDALRRRLEQENGPEVVVVTIRRSRDWIARASMDVVRAREMERLRSSDRHGRLRVYVPVNDGAAIYVHSKVTIVDDAFLYLGSANLSNRSMTLDSECGIAVDGTDAASAQSIRSLMCRLLAEHLGTRPEEVRRALGSTGSLVGAVEELSGGSRTLEVLDDEVPRFLRRVMPKDEILDLEKPIGQHPILERAGFSVEPAETHPPSADRLSRRRERVDPSSLEDERRGWSVADFVRASAGALVLVLVVVVVLVWQLTPLSSWIHPEDIAGWAEPYRTSAATPLVLVAAYVVVLGAGVPATVLVLATVLGLGPLMGGIYAWTGMLVSALTSYALGRWLGRRPLERLVGSRVRDVTDRFAGGSVLAMSLLRVVPVAPFAVVNMAAGATGVRLFPYTLGTMIGHVPGVLAISLLGHGLMDALLDPGWGTYLVLAALAALIVTASVLAYRRLA